MQMELPTIFSSTLGLSPPWQISAVSFAKDEKRLDITVDYLNENILPCPFCGAKTSRCLMTSETWFHEDFFRYATYLHARVPHFECCGAIVPVERPWMNSGSKFTQTE
jgi:hypothetical protein